MSPDSIHIVENRETFETNKKNEEVVEPITKSKRESSIDKNPNLAHLRYSKNSENSKNHTKNLTTSEDGFDIVGKSVT